MDFFKATNGAHWYISIDGGETFELCQREPFLTNKIASPDEIPIHDPIDSSPEVSLDREQLEQRGFIISRVTG